MQTYLARALMWSKGFGSEETNAALSRAHELVANVDDPSERLATSYGQWASNYMRGEYMLAGAFAETFLHEAERNGRTPEVASGHRILGLTLQARGEFAAAALRFEKALTHYNPQWSADEKFRVALEPGLTTMTYFAITKLALGEIEHARDMIDAAVTKAIETGHVPTVGSSLALWTLFEAISGDPAHTEHAARAAAEYTKTHSLGQYRAMARVQLGWALAKQGKLEAGIRELSEGIAGYSENGNKAHMPFFMGLLAEVVASAEIEQGLSQIDAALAFAQEIGEHYTDVLLHRIRGEILSRLDLMDKVAAEQAFRAAIWVAKKQGARFFELRAALALAKLYLSIGRSTDAHAALAPALEDFRPTAALTEVAEAHALLAELDASDPVRRKRRTRDIRSKYARLDD